MAARVGTDVAFYTFSLYVLTYITGTPYAVSAYVLVALLITLVALAFAPETSRLDLHAS